MKLTFRVNPSESLIIQKSDILYTNEQVDRINDSKRIVSVFTKFNYWIHFSIHISEMKNAFTYLTHDEQAYVLKPYWLKLVDGDGSLIKSIRDDG